jgi:hypothetical protein
LEHLDRQKESSMRIPKRVAVLLLPAALGLSASPRPPLDPVAVEVTVSPATSRGPCPATFTFTGKVLLRKEVKVKYRWERSDGVPDTAPHPALALDGVHASLVTTTWTLGAATPAFHPYRGWMKLHILAPEDKLSDAAEFTLDCGAPPSSNCNGKPDLVPLLHTPMDGWVGVKNVGTGDAGPSRLLIKCAREGYAGPGGGCVDLPASAIVPPFFSTPDGLVLNVPAIPCGKELSFPMAWFGNTKWPSGTYRFTAIADFTNAVIEGNEDNNKTTSTLVR